MRTLARNRLVHVWLILTVITVASWLTTRDGGATHHLNSTVTVVVLLIAAAKAHLVIWHFMEVDRAPRWLRATTTGWVIAIFGLLLGIYFSAP